MRFLVIFAALFFAAGLARAAGGLANPTLVPDKNDSAVITNNFSGEITAQPVCFDVINTATYTMQGTFYTDFYKTPEGVASRHQANFRLGANEKTNFCAAGPFYPGRKLELVIRTLVPVFNCRTAINGPVVIHGKRNDHDDGNVTWADCR